ncbi:phosphoribosylformylglycinamidine cyclo-ligase [Verrucomicrobia bacterium LW23]|nr:phosphoribosylformylglycinamidine cyclo-ligase [Verrucomicrobia bacterium LW23]
MNTKAYAKAGVDVDLGNKVKSGIEAMVSKTRRPEVISSVGGFGGLFLANFPQMKEPVLVSSVDGVGTKLKVAGLLNRHDTIGEDLVNHCINDIACIGAEPIFFLDYIGTSRLDPHMFKQILEGLTRACAAANCALIGGETAQMPGIYHGSDYDLVGCIVGVVDRAQMIDGKANINVGDKIIGLPSTGLHTNGYSLARELIFNKLSMRVGDLIPGQRTKETIGQALLRTHVSYLPDIRALRAAGVELKGIAHITGGGLIDNLPRVLPETMDAEIKLGSWTISPLFKFLASTAGVPDSELYQVFNMGIGMTIVVREDQVKKALETVKGKIIGEIVPGEGVVKLVKKK